jgi:hypothetical protein
MKTRLLSLLFLSALFCVNTFETKAQSQRLQLFEYFDNTSIPPFGAVANANVDSLVLNHSNKIACIKYHVAWGSMTGTDPMNLQNPLQPLTRVNYYKVTADPEGKQDGAVTADSTFHGQPSTFTGAMINKRSSVTSPFTISVSHVLNTAHDTIFTHTVVKKTGAVVTTGSLVAHVVVIEKIIRFTTPPGQSGDKNFQNVMKQMLPADTGTILPAMNIGDSLVLDLPWKLANVYDENQLCVVSFVQGKDSTNREIYQAGQSFPIPVALDAGMDVIANNAFHCDSIDQKVILKNFGLNTLTTCDINYKVDAGAPSTMPWTGSLATGATATVTIHMTGLTGSHNMTIYSSNPNGSADLGHFNDTVLTKISFASVPVASLPNEGFQGTFAPANWAVVNPDNSLTWTRDSTVGAFGSSNKSTRLDFYNIADTTQSDDLYPPQLNLTAATGHLYLHFDVAYAQYLKPITDPLVYHDTLQVNISTDCGAIWTTPYSKTGSALETSPPVGPAFFPLPSQWRHEIMNLTSFVGQNNVLMRFHGMSGFGNNVFLDNINTSTSALNAAMSSAALPNSLPCDSINVTGILKNTGFDTITTCTLNYKVDAGSTVSTPWTGTLLPAATTTFTVHLTGLTGSHNLKIYLSNPNGVPDAALGDDTTNVNVIFAPAPVAAPLVQGFQVAAFPPPTWSVVNPDKGLTWKQGLVGGSGWSSRSAELEFYNDSVGQTDDLYAPNLDLSLDTGHVYCLFDVAYARRNATARDTFEVNVTKDCGATWSTLYSKSDTVLATVSTLSGLPFTPNASKWRMETVDLTSFIGQSNVMLRFRGKSRHGNNLYIDDINISHNSTGVPSLGSISELELYPNPSNGIVNLNIRFVKTQSLNVNITNMLGETISKNNFGKTDGGIYPLNLSAYPSGIYFVKIITDGQTQTKKIIINK